jgi:hypothetical protein
MGWPVLVHISEVQPRLILDGLPVERAMRAVSELATLHHGGRYRVEHSEGDLYFYAQGSGYYRVASE